MATRKPTGFIAYRGPSLIDGSPIVVVVVTAKSSNRKTGSMVQTYILRADQNPVAAVKSGADVSICGDCKHRGDKGQGRSCYVNLGHGARSGLPHVSARRIPRPDRERRRALRGPSVRLGSTAIPLRCPLECGSRCCQARPDGPDTRTNGVARLPASCFAWRALTPKASVPQRRCSGGVVQSHRPGRGDRCSRDPLSCLRRSGQADPVRALQALLWPVASCQVDRDTLARGGRGAFRAGIGSYRALELLVAARAVETRQAG